MTRFCITFSDNETNEVTEEIVEFEDFVGRPTDSFGNPWGKEVKISAREWAEDYAYSKTDKGSIASYIITEL